MATPTLGLILDGTDPGRARRDDPVDIVVARVSFLDPPRAAAGRKFGERLRATFGEEIRVAVYAWCHVTHGPGDPLPHPSTRALRAPVNEGGHLRDTETVREAWETTLRFADAAGATTVVLRTPPAFTPGAAQRRRLAEFVGGAGRDLVWEAEGLWDAQTARALADPLGMPVLVRGIGATGRPAEDADGCWREISGQLRPATADLVAYALMDDPSKQAVALFSGPRGLANLRLVARAAELAP